MQKTDRRGVARRQDGRFRQTVQTGSRLAQATIGQVGRVPLPWIVSTTLPANAVLPSEHFVQTLDTRTLNAAQLIDGSALWSRLAKPHVVHLAHDLQTGIRIKCQARLVKQAVCPSAAGLPRGVQPDSSFPYPYQKTAHPRGKTDGRVRNSSARLQHQTGQTPYRYMGSYAIAINYNESAVKDIQAPFFNEENCRPVLDRDGARRSHTRGHGHGENILRKRNAMPILSAASDWAW